MENTIKIVDKTIGDNTYQFRYESATKRVEILVKKNRKAHWYSDKRIDYWEPFQMGEIELGRGLVGLQGMTS